MRVCFFCETEELCFSVLPTAPRLCRTIYVVFNRENNEKRMTQRQKVSRLHPVLERRVRIEVEDLGN